MLGNLKDSTRLALGFGGLTVLGVTMALVAMVEMSGLARSIESVAEDRMPKMEMAQRLMDDFNTAGRYARTVPLLSDPKARTDQKQRIAEAKVDADRLLEQLDKVITLPAARTSYRTIVARKADYNASLDRFVERADAGAPIAELSDLIQRDVRVTQAPVFSAVQEFVDVQREAVRAEARVGADNAHRDVTLLIGMAVAMGLVGSAAGWALTRKLRRALGAEPDELGAVARRVAAGDLGPVADAGRAPAGSVLASLGEMQSRLASIVGQVRNSSDSIATGSAQIAVGNTDLSQRTEEQASNLQQTAASMEQLAGNVRTTAETASHANQLATNASAAAVKGGEMVGHVVTTMQDIAASSRKIADIIGVIDGIAFQTNILALNAAVEAARAGEQGRGFAVVATEVRNLASRSAGAAKEIKTLIGASVAKVESGTRQVSDAGASMGDIVAQVQRVSQAIGEIAVAANDQSTGIGQVGHAVTQLDQVTQQNAALVEESAAAAESLKHQAAQLAAVVNAFKLSDTRAPAAAAPQPAVVRQAPRATANPPQSKRPDATRTPMPPAPVKRNPPAASAPAPAATPAIIAPRAAVPAGHDDWETF